MDLEKRSDAILLAILPKYAKMILSGVKKYEFRRVSPKIRDPIRVLLFTTNRTEQIVGEFIATKLITAPVKELIETTEESVPHERSELENYFSGLRMGHAIEIRSPRRYKPPISINKIREFIPDFVTPRNYIYLNRKDSKYGQLFKLIPSDRKIRSPQIKLDAFVT